MWEERMSSRSYAVPLSSLDENEPSTDKSEMNVQCIFEDKFVLESDFEENLEERNACPLQGNETSHLSLFRLSLPFPVVSKFSKNILTLETYAPQPEICSLKCVFEAVKFSVKEPTSKITLEVAIGWRACKITSVIFGTDEFNHYHCPFSGCIKKFRKRYKMRWHLTTFHHGPFYCPVVDCGKVFLSKPSKVRRKKTHRKQHFDCTRMESYHSKQIMNLCVFMCKNVENSPYFYMQKFTVD